MGLTKMHIGVIFIFTSLIHLTIFVKSELGYKWDYAMIFVGIILMILDRIDKVKEKK